MLFCCLVNDSCLVSEKGGDCDLWGVNCMWLFCLLGVIMFWLFKNVGEDCEIYVLFMCCVM